jgi:ribosomal protein L11 methyltransferase
LHARGSANVGGSTDVSGGTDAAPPATDDGPESATRWLRVDVEIGDPELEPLVSDGLIELGASAVQQLPSALRTYLPVSAAADPNGIMRRVASALSHGPGIEPERIRFHLEPEADWLAEWRAGLGPRRIGRRIVVSPTWSEPDLSTSDLDIRIDPQMAFGTGEHASTRGVLRLLEAAIRPDARVLDMGTGSGILAIAAVLLGASDVVAVENDPDALINARENVRHNGVEDRIRLVQGTVDARFLERHETAFDVVVANVLSGVLVPLLRGLGATRRRDGRLILGGILAEEAASVEAAAARAGLELVDVDVEQGWWSARLAGRADRAIQAGA